MKQTALVTDIQHFSLHDGPGIRTTVFFKGCPLKCRWCHNPEAISGKRDLMFYRQFCTLCGKCIESCPEDCITIENNELEINRETCTACGECVTSCAAEALELKGKALSVDEIVKECLVDYKYYKKTGGVSLSGGEPLIQGAFIFDLMRSLKSGNIHIVLDTCGYIDYKILEQAREWVDLFYYDLKCISSDKHIEWTGVDNKIILENMRKLLEAGADLTARVPVIPGFNAEISEIKMMIDFLRPYKDKVTVHLLPYHNLGSSKYLSLGQPYLMQDAVSPEKDVISTYQSLFKDAGINSEQFSK